MSYFETRLNEALDDIPEVPDEESVWNIDEYIDGLTKRDPNIERILLEGSGMLGYAIGYAKKFFGRVGWPKLEKKIKNNHLLAYYYAMTVLEDRFPEGEEAISNHPWYAFVYARDVIGGRFPAGEKAIYRVSYPAKEYDKFLREVGEL